MHSVTHTSAPAMHGAPTAVGSPPPASCNIPITDENQVPRQHGSGSSTPIRCTFDILSHSLKSDTNLARQDPFPIHVSCQQGASIQTIPKPPLGVFFHPLHPETTQRTRQRQQVLHIQNVHRQLPYISLSTTVVPLDKRQAVHLSGHCCRLHRETACIATEAAHKARPLVPCSSVVLRHKRVQ